MIFLQNQSLNGSDEMTLYGGCVRKLALRLLATALLGLTAAPVQAGSWGVAHGLPTEEGEMGASGAQTDPFSGRWTLLQVGPYSGSVTAFYYGEPRVTGPDYFRRDVLIIDSENNGGVRTNRLTLGIYCRTGNTVEVEYWNFDAQHQLVSSGQPVRSWGPVQPDTWQARLHEATCAADRPPAEVTTEVQQHALALFRREGR